MGIDVNTHCSGIDENTDCSGSVTCTETCDESTHSLTSTTESNDEIPHNDTNTVSKLNDLIDEEMCNLQIKTDMITF